MAINRALSIAFIISVTAHCCLFAPWPAFSSLLKVKSVKQEYNRPLEVNYFEIKVTARPKVAAEPKEGASKAEADKTAQKSITAVSRDSMTFAKSETQPAPKATKTVSEKSEGVYLDYYTVIREKIRASLLGLYTRKYGEGDIQLEFTLNSNGTLNGLDILEDRSVSVRELRSITLKALQKASPFPPFPVELKEPQIDFNVIISFKKQ